jgi:dihydropteroate synthase
MSLAVRKEYQWRLARHMLVLGKRTIVMGVLNVTPDSFSDGGVYVRPEVAVERALAMQDAGADILDIGGESTRPGSNGVAADEELRRVLPVLESLRGKLRIPVSIDTTKAAVADAAGEAGAEIVNDVTALAGDPGMARVVWRRRMGVILMHMRGNPRNMQKMAFAPHVLPDVRKGLGEAVKRAEKAGIHRSKIILDPGIGFGKSFQQNFELIVNLPVLAKMDFPLLVGASRKMFIGEALGGAAPEKRVWGTAAAVTASILAGAHIVRVHDTAEMAQVARVADEVLAAGDGAGKKK